MEEQMNTYYDPEKRRAPWLRIVIIILVSLIAILLMLLIVKLFSKGPNMYDKLVDMSKNYISNYPTELGNCETYKLKDMITNQTDETKKIFTKCDEEETYVKVCNVGQDKYTYTPVLSCKNKTTSFTDWKIGTLDDVKLNNSDIQVLFDGEILEHGVRNFYPNNETDIKKVAQYYVSSPNEEYKYKTNATTAYKWYVAGKDKEYYNNGEYAAVQPDGYSLNEDTKNKTYITTYKPSEESYRTIKNSLVYAIEYVSYPYKYVCVDKNYAGTITTDTVCERRNSNTFKTTKDMYYTCDGVNTVERGTICKKRSNWTAASCKNEAQTLTGKTSDGFSYTRQVSNGLTCIETSGYVVTDKVSKWYKLVDANKYYPSNSSNIEEENTYFVTTPIAGASKDLKTETKAYQYFKLVQTDENITNWVSINDEALTKEELINMYRENGIDVNTLNDIDNNENIRYQMVIKYRNRK